MRPRDAATLIIIRNRREVLLGQRNSGHVFMPHRYVFPGGRVDAGDARVPSPISLRQDVEARLTRSVTPARARALAMAAVRETWEEAGLVLGQSVDEPPQSRSEHWRDFYATGHVPALDKLDYIARAITPPGRVRRFDARFFLVDAQHLGGELRGNGELGDLQWVPLEESTELPVAIITRMILELLKERYGLPARVDELKHALGGRELPEYYP